MTSPTPLETVKAYYHHVDSAQYEQLLALFADNAIYRRCKLVLSGKDELRQFYCGDRDLVGAHTIDTLIDQEKIVIAEGSFRGTKAGVPFQVGFSDFFWFNDGGKIRERHTYTDQGRV